MAIRNEAAGWAAVQFSPVQFSSSQLSSAALRARTGRVEKARLVNPFPVAEDLRPAIGVIPPNHSKPT